jgi:hypothetical protein
MDLWLPASAVIQRPIGTGDSTRSNAGCASVQSPERDHANLRNLVGERGVETFSIGTTGIPA